jgi:hypothetical protein
MGIFLCTNFCDALWLNISDDVAIKVNCDNAVLLASLLDLLKRVLC